jgi:hypothetical protein
MTKDSMLNVVGQCREFPYPDTPEEIDEATKIQELGELLQAESKCFYLQNPKAGYLGNSPMFWGTNGGYTAKLDAAKRFTEAEADQTIRECRSHGFIKWSCDEVDAVSHRTVGMQDLRKS